MSMGGNIMVGIMVGNTKLGCIAAWWAILMKLAVGSIGCSVVACSARTLEAPLLSILLVSSSSKS